MENEILTLKSKTSLNCSICDRCCKYRGDIRLTPINVLEISKFLKLDLKEFVDTYTMPLEEEPPEIVIKAIGEDRLCIFNDKKTCKCKIHKFRPIQCVMFPLYPVDVKNDLFVNQGTCIVETKKKTSVNKWLNGDNIYKRNKDIYLKWIELIEEIQPRWNTFPKEKQVKIREVLFLEYDLKKSFKKQILENMKKVREIIYK